MQCVQTPPFTSIGPICLHGVARPVPRPVWIGPKIRNDVCQNVTDELAHWIDNGILVLLNFQMFWTSFVRRYVSYDYVYLYFCDRWQCRTEVTPSGVFLLRVAKPALHMSSIWVVLARVVPSILKNAFWPKWVRKKLQFAFSILHVESVFFFFFFLSNLWSFMKQCLRCCRPLHWMMISVCFHWQYTWRDHWDESLAPIKIVGCKKSHGDSQLVQLEAHMATIKSQKGLNEFSDGGGGGFKKTRTGKEDTKTLTYPSDMLTLLGFVAPQMFCRCSEEQLKRVTLSLSWVNRAHA